MHKYLKLLSLTGVTVLLLTGCSLFGGKAEKLASEEDQTSFIEKTAETFEEAKEFTMKGNSTSTENGQTVSFDLTLEVEGENSEMLWQIDESKLYITTVDGVSYMSSDNKEWFNLGSSDTSGLTDTTDFTSFSEELDNEDYEYIGVEDCGNDQCQVYKYTDDNGETKIYINADNNEVVKVTTSSTNEAGEEEKAEFTIEYTADISAPNNATELSEEEAATKLFELFFGFFSAAGVEM